MGNLEDPGAERNDLESCQQQVHKRTRMECFAIWWEDFGRRKAEELAGYSVEKHRAEDIASAVWQKYYHLLEKDDDTDRSLLDLKRQLPMVVRNLVIDFYRKRSEHALEGDAPVHSDGSTTLLETVQDSRPESDPFQYASRRELERKVNLLLEEGIEFGKLTWAEVETWINIRIYGEDQRSQREQYGWKSNGKVTNACAKVSDYLRARLEAKMKPEEKMKREEKIKKGGNH